MFCNHQENNVSKTVSIDILSGIDNKTNFFNLCPDIFHSFSLKINGTRKQVEITIIISGRTLKREPKTLTYLIIYTIL